MNKKILSNIFHSRYNSNVIRLANNNLVDTTGLYQMALDVVEFPEDIAWLDLSFNEISDVSDDILEFPGIDLEMGLIMLSPH